MKKTENWELLRSGMAQQAIKRIESSYRKLPVPHMVIELGAAYLFARQYENAWQHFSTAIKANNRPVSDFFGLAGAAKWCLGDSKEAVRQWNSGFSARFSDTAGLGVRLPLLLYAASVIRPETVSRKSVEGILVSKITDPRITEWPGPLASLLLHRINLDTLRDTYIVGKETMASGRLWEAEFYRAILLREDGETKECRKILSHLVDTSLEEWSDQSFFERRIRSEEFFIARFEIEGN